MPFDYPDRLSLEVLNREMPGRDRHLKALQEIEILYEGGTRLERNIDKFLKQRSTEDVAVYNKRKTRISYEGHFGEAIKGICDRFSTGSVVWGEVNQRWSDFRSDVDARGTPELKFLQELFRRYLLEGCLFVLAENNIEKPEEITNQAQLDASGAKGWLCLLSLRDVLEYELDRFGRVSWLKYCSVSTTQPLTGDPEHVATWTFVDEMAIAKYQAAVEISSGGKIIGLKDPTNSDNEVELLSLILHKRGQTPVEKLEADPIDHIGNQVYLLAKQHLNEASSNYDAALSAGYIQRTYEKPVRDTSDLGSTAESTGVPTKHGNATVFEGKLSFSEFVGTSIQTVRGELDQVGQRIHQLVMLSGDSITRTALMQSGASKHSDRELEEISLKGYGGTILSFYQRCVELLADAFSEQAPELQGLDRFQVAMLDRLIEKLERLAAPSVLPLIPALMVQKLLVKIGEELLAGASPEEKRLLVEAIAKIQTAQPTSPQPEPQ